MNSVSKCSLGTVREVSAAFGEEGKKKSYLEQLNL